MSPSIRHSFGAITFPKSSPRVLWRYTIKSHPLPIDIAPPLFEINGKPTPAVLKAITPLDKPRTLSNGAVEHTFIGDFAKNPNLSLKLTFRVVPSNPIIRFKYELQSRAPVTLTKKSGHDNLEYFKFSARDFPACKEIRLSEFDESIHSFRLIEHEIRPSAFANSLNAMGPILVASDENQTLLAAYEHGSQAPDAFVAFHFAPDRSITLRAVKGNYCSHQHVTADTPFDTLWFQFAAIGSTEDALAKHYRRFVLHHMTLNSESRKPYIFYNTWNYQERNKWWNHDTFLGEMHEKRMLAEIDVAHRMGVDVFVIDTGWYQKTGDWEVNLNRFSRNLAKIKQKLDRYGMKLGLWFSPTEAAVSSRLANAHLINRATIDDKLHDPQKIWETEESYRMCIVSSYWESFADELIRLCKEIGVTYFKWDAIRQYGCNDPHHDHGGTSDSPSEREDNYAFQQIRYMQRVIDKLCAACPQAIVDFDITEGHRSVGLAFLASGKYFLINNGPYFHSLDFPRDHAQGMGVNVFVFPGPARARLCRAPLDFDKWIPSVLFLTHYLPDDPESSQLINIASLILGQNGIWGDLLAVSKPGVARFRKFLDCYKQVRDDITAADPIRSGVVGGSPEIHEKIDSRTGRGAVCIFTASPGTYTYVTKNKVTKPFQTHDNVKVTHLSSGQARIDFNTQSHAARMIFFGAS